MGHTWSPGKSPTSQCTQALEPKDTFLKVILYNDQLLIFLIKSHWACKKQGGPPSFLGASVSYVPWEHGSGGEPTPQPPTQGKYIVGDQ